MFYDQTQQNTHIPSIPRSVHHFNSASIQDTRPRKPGELLRTNFVFLLATTIMTIIATIMIKTSCGDGESGSPTDNSTGEPD